MPAETLSLDEARRIALAAQGFDRPRLGRRVDASAIRRTIRRLGLVQLDYVNVVVPAHYLVLFSRLGPYQRALLDEAAYRGGEFTEQWAHEASIVPIGTWPLLRYRRESHRVRPNGFDSFMAQHPDYVQRVLDEVRARGPLSAEDLPAPEGRSRRLDEAWFGTVPRAVLEAHFGRGLLAVADRRPGFVRAFDLAERVLPPGIHARRVEREDAQRALVLDAARAHGVGTAGDLADYYRMSVPDARRRLADLVESGAVREVRVDGWREPAYLHAAARVPVSVDAAALLAPFDPLIWHRPRTLRLFGFDYRFEIFVPQPKRKWGTYVLPFLLGDRLVARVDLKADRAARRLRVLGAYRETGTDGEAAAAALAGELRALAAWLGLDAITIGRRGNFAPTLAAAVRAARAPGPGPGGPASG